MGEIVSEESLQAEADAQNSKLVKLLKEIARHENITKVNAKDLQIHLGALKVV